ncbi:FeoA domain-containing protein [Acidovorax sp. NCPPB 2350]|nr:FeoA domain-containing protein [Acidovorax sp. NCPPB 2350]
MKMSEGVMGPAVARPSAMTDLVGLDRLPRGTPACVMELQPASDEREQAILQRLMEIGFLPGEPVRVVASGFPGGDPIAVRIGQATFALRRHEAALVRVRPGEGAA